MRYLVQTVVRLRSNPSTSGSVITGVPAGTQVPTVSDQQVTADGYTWVNIEYDNRQGWVALGDQTEEFLVPVFDISSQPAGQQPVAPQPAQPAARPAQPAQPQEPTP